MSKFPGSCHCGRLAFVYETADVRLRVCDCTLCRRYGARTSNDPAGSVRWFVRRPDRLVRYRHGLRTADFLVCETCGVYAGALQEKFTTVNANTFEEAIGGAGELVPCDDEEGAEARMARRRVNWTPVVEWLEWIPALKAQLVTMVELDVGVREELAASGSLQEGYHQRLERVHLRNAARLDRILDEEGWPRKSVVGDDAATAAWTIVYHAISAPDVMRRGLALISAAAVGDEASRVHTAMLQDRVLSYEGKPQRHGTQFDWDREGRMSPLPLDDARKVDERRKHLGLKPLSDEIARRRTAAAEAGEPPFGDVEARLADRARWLRRVGWRA
jgi:hypothetical protein